MNRILSFFIISILSLSPFFLVNKEDGEPDYIDDDGVYYYYDDDDYYYYPEGSDKYEPRIQHCYLGQEVEFPEVEREGYIFRGWSEDGINTLDKYIVCGDSALIALWAKEVCKVKIDATLGYVNGEKTYEIDCLPFDTIVNILSEFEYTYNDSFMIGGFYYDQSYEEPVEDTDILYDDVIVYCKWEKNTANLNLELFGGNINGKCEDNTIEVSKNLPFFDTIKDIIPTKHGYVFSGWYLDSEFESIIDEDTCSYADTTIYAKYDLLNVKTIFNFIGVDGVEIKDPYSLYFPYNTPLEDALPIFADLYYKVSDSYYVFDGWYSERSYKEEYHLSLSSSVDYYDEKDPCITYYAFFKYASISLVLGPEEGVNKTSSNIELSLTKDEFDRINRSVSYSLVGEVNEYVTKDGYLFDYWTYNGKEITFDNILSLLSLDKENTIIAHYTEAYVLTFVCKGDEYFDGYKGTNYSQRLSYLIKIGTWFDSPPVVVGKEETKYTWDVSSQDLMNADYEYLNPNGMNMPSGSVTFTTTPDDVDSTTPTKSWFSKYGLFIIIPLSIIIIASVSIVIFLVIRKKKETFLPLKPNL